MIKILGINSAQTVLFCILVLLLLLVLFLVLLLLVLLLLVLLLLLLIIITSAKLAQLVYRDGGRGFKHHPDQHSGS